METTVNLRIEVPANLELLLKERAQQAGVPVESFVLQAVTERLAESEANDSTMNAEEFSLCLGSGPTVFLSSTILSTIAATQSTLDAVNESSARHEHHHSCRSAESTSLA